MKKSNGRILMFLRRNAVYLVLAFCILAVGLSITLMLVNRENQVSVDSGKKPSVVQPIDPDDGKEDEPANPDTPVDPVIKPVVFIMPVANASTIGEYGDTMVWNSTLGHYTSHLGIDFFAEEGTPVYAVYDGTVKSVESNLLKGVTITIDHGNGLYTIYNSLADGETVTVGQKVLQGDMIGEVSVSNRTEYKDGAHLHFEVMEDGVLIDPIKYLAIEEK